MGIIFKQLTKSKFRPNTKRIYGFDIETFNRNKSFLLASIVGDLNYQKTFFSKKELVDELKSGVFNHSIICATNLSFDFFGTFFDSEELKNFTLLFRGSDLLYAKTYVYNKKFNLKSNRNKTSITFLDTLNYAKLSVEKLGTIVGLNKLEKPKRLGMKPKNKQEWDELITYNLRDSEISQKALTFFYNSFEEIGAAPKLTLASTSLSLFKNKYLKDDYEIHQVSTLLKIFEAYYGGRTECFKRGTFKDYNYYDVNSLYPSVMRKSYPDPNSIRFFKGDRKDLLEYEGVSKVKIFSPTAYYPFLPYRTKEKLIFPCGTFEGWYTNVELRKAMSLGYKILKLYEGIYYKETITPFIDFVTDMYNLRLEHKKAESNMELVIKILMNALYGKFAQKFMDKDSLIPLNHTVEELEKYKKFEIIGDFLRIVEDREPSSFCVPIWSAYVTAYGRIKLHDYMLKLHPIYVDTDSLITKKEHAASNELGALKLEHRISKGVIVKPKFYSIDDKTKIKGIGKKIVMMDFMNVIDGKEIAFNKFMKLRESIRRNFQVNEIQKVTKYLSLEDNKRNWHGKTFNINQLQESSPICLN